jgi:hypothetical protein
VTKSVDKPEDSHEPDVPEGRPFAVADKLFCCWDWDHRSRTLEFLDGLDPDHFATVARLLGEQLEFDDRVAASVALRVLYHQGVETLMSLLGAVAQGPSVAPAWIAKCRTEDLREVVAALLSGRALLTEVGTHRTTFQDVSEQVHAFTWTDETGDESTASRFARFWMRMAGEFLDEDARAEYNALKHGSRVLPGGFTLAIGVEESFGVAPPPGMMRSLGGSDFGSTFFAAERVGRTSWHVRTRRTSLNWLPVPLAQRLQLVSMSIGNIVGGLRCNLGVDPTTVRFTRPSEPATFTDVWSHVSGIKRFNVDSKIEIEPRDELTREALREYLEHPDSGS